MREQQPKEIREKSNYVLSSFRMQLWKNTNFFHFSSDCECRAAAIKIAAAAITVFFFRSFFSHHIPLTCLIGALIFCVFFIFVSMLFRSRRIICSESERRCAKCTHNFFQIKISGGFLHTLNSGRAPTSDYLHSSSHTMERNRRKYKFMKSKLNIPRNNLRSHQLYSMMNAIHSALFRVQFSDRENYQHSVHVHTYFMCIVYKSQGEKANINSVMSWWPRELGFLSNCECKQCQVSMEDCESIMHVRRP